jgi:hypothetical protein
VRRDMEVPAAGAAFSIDIRFGSLDIRLVLN